MPASLTQFATDLLRNQCGSQVYRNEHGTQVTLLMFHLHCIEYVAFVVFTGTEVEIVHYEHIPDCNAHARIVTLARELNLIPDQP